MDKHSNSAKKRKPRQLETVKPSKFAASEAVHANKNYWKEVFDNIDRSTRAIENESKQLSSVLPRNLYLKVCDTLDIPVTAPLVEDRGKESDHDRRRTIKEPLLSYRKKLYIDREMDSDTDVEFSQSSDEEEVPNVHRQLLKKPEREQVTWATHYLEPEREDEKSLVKKADDLTDRIAKEFCEYMTQLGGNQQSQLFTPKAIKELFQIEFDTHVARSLRIIPKELPSVGEKIATVTGNPEKSKRSVLERHVASDIRVEHRPDNLRGFNQSLPLKEQWRTPRNDTAKMWRSARRVPKDLVTLKTVWEGITNLRSVKDYCRWMIDHPQYRRAPYLNSLGMFDPAVMNARINYEQNNEDYTPPVVSRSDPPAPIENIRRRLSVLSNLLT